METNASLSFARDIRPMFTEIDVDHMKAAGMDLSDRDNVEKNAEAILRVVRDGSMPPKNTGERWTPEMCEVFRRWMEAGHPG